MLHFQFWPSTPTFNVADICIVRSHPGAVYYVLIYEKTRWERSRMEPLILQADGEDAESGWTHGWRRRELTRSPPRSCGERPGTAGKLLAKNTRSTGAETVSALLPEPETVDIVPGDIPLTRRVDEGCHRGQQAQGAGGHPAPGYPDGTLVNALLYHSETALSGINGELRLGYRPPHRPAYLRPHHCRRKTIPPMSGWRHSPRTIPWPGHTAASSWKSPEDAAR